MIRIDGRKISTSMFDGHEHVCDLIDVDGPLLSLYTDSRDNWLYLWCDTDKSKVNRWMLLRLSRASLVSFFERRVSLRELVIQAGVIIVLDETTTRTEKAGEEGKPSEISTSIKRKFIKIDDASDLEIYWPSAESFFNPDLCESIDVRQQIAPSKHFIPVDGRWYFRDLDGFSRTYAKVYAFLYSTKPQFINSMNERLHDLLRAPWTGGYSRVNLFSQLRRGLPALHDLQIDRFSYASPGAIEVEALPSICEDVSNIVLSSKDHWSDLKFHDRVIGSVIGGLKLKKVDLSLVPDSRLPLTSEYVGVLERSCTTICEILGVVDRMQALRSASPNLIVYAKAVQALVGQVERLAAFEQQGLLNLAKTQVQARADVFNE